MARTGAPGALRADRRRVWVDLGAKLWALAVSHPRLLRAHMIIPASAVGGVRMQWSPDQCAVVGIGRLFFQLASGCSWLAGARHGK
jgi:hypothetical protein